MHNITDDRSQMTMHHQREYVTDSGSCYWCLTNHASWLHTFFGEILDRFGFAVIFAVYKTKSFTKTAAFAKNSVLVSSLYGPIIFFLFLVTCAKLSWPYSAFSVHINLSYCRPIVSYSAHKQARNIWEQQRCIGICKSRPTAFCI